MVIVGDQARQDKNCDCQNDEENAERSVSGDDLVAQDASYHDQTRNRVVSNTREKTGDADDAVDEGSRKRKDSFACSRSK